MRRLIVLFPIFLFIFSGYTYAQTQLSSADKKTVADFRKRAQRYVDRREWLRGKLPKIATDATPEQVEAFQDSLQKAVQADRVNTRPGDVFTQQAAILIRNMIKKEFTDFERSELRKQVLEADTKGVQLKANIPYPESKELVHMPPTLLMTLPELPRELRYRFIGRSLAILDRDSSLIVDFMRDALP